MLSEKELIEYKALYRQADTFKKLKPWSWLFETDIFGVKVPGTDRTYYCVVTGSAGEVMALHAFQGHQGLQSYFELFAMRNQKEELYPLDILMVQKSLMVSFENKDQLLHEEIGLLKELGLSYRGKNSWTRVKDFSPGYLPVNKLSAEQVKDLTWVLRQAADIAQKVENFELNIEDPDRVLVAVPENAKGSNFSYQWEEIPAEQISYLPEKININENTVNGLKQLMVSEDSWLLDFFLSPVPTCENEEDRAELPVIAVWTTQRAKKTLKTEVFSLNELSDRLPKGLLDLCYDQNEKPKSIFTPRKAAVEILQPYLTDWNISVHQVSVPALHEIRKSILKNAKK